MWALYLFGLLFFIILFHSIYGFSQCQGTLGQNFPTQNGGFISLTNQSGGALDYTAYFAPWWRQYYGATPLYGTSSTAVDQFLIDPGTTYNWNTYWENPTLYDYWRKPYYYARKVFRPYLQDSIPGRRLRKQFYHFHDDTDVENGVQAKSSSSMEHNPITEEELGKSEKINEEELTGSYKYGVFEN